MVIQLQTSSQFKAGTIAGNKISFAPEAVNVDSSCVTPQLVDFPPIEVSGKIRLLQTLFKHVNVLGELGQPQLGAVAYFLATSNAV